MKIETGLFDRAVLQRDRRNVSQSAFSGQCDVDGEVRVSVRRGTRLVHRMTVPALNSQFAGTLAGVPAGGPYEIELALMFRGGKSGGRRVVRGVLVGDLWLAAGQSNMEGVGRRAGDLRAMPGVHALTLDDRWVVAKDPIHSRINAIDAVFQMGTHTQKGIGVGPAVAFAQRMRELTGVPQGVIACAKGATSMNAWSPDKLAEGGASLYGSMIRRLRRSGGRVAGMIWYQGESDALEKAHETYARKTADFFEAVRAQAGDAKLPIAMAQIARVVGWGSAPEWNAVQEAQRKSGESHPGVALVPAIDLPLDDTIHLSTAGEHRLGARFAYAMHTLRKGRPAGKLPIRLADAMITRTHPAHDLVEVVLTFENVVGGFTSGGARPAGFVIGDPAPTQAVFDIRLEGRRIRLLTTFNAEQVGTRVLYYGHGTDPYVNIVDGADRSIPVMGAIPLASMRRG